MENFTRSMSLSLLTTWEQLIAHIKYTKKINSSEGCSKIIISWLIYGMIKINAATFLFTKIIIDQYIMECIFLKIMSKYPPAWLGDTYLFFAFDLFKVHLCCIDPLKPREFQRHSFLAP